VWTEKNKSKEITQIETLISPNQGIC